MSTMDWIGIVAIASAQVGTVLAVVWKFASWMARIEMKVDVVISKTLTDHEDRIRDLEKQ